MRTLITGAGGFVGKHLVKHLLAQGDEVHGTYHRSKPTNLPEDVLLHALDVRDPEAVTALVRHVMPAQIYHLAAQAFVPFSFDDPWHTLETNIRGQVNLTLACQMVGIKPRILAVSSAQIYGVVHPGELPVTEDAELRPTSPYAVSKIAQDMLALSYFNSHGLPVMVARPFNHIGPGQDANFVAPAFATQIARIEMGLQSPVISVGDLSATRDFTDVRDIARAYHSIMTHGEPGVAYNVASGVETPVQSLLDGLLALSTLDIEVQIDQSKLRPAAIPRMCGAYDRLKAATGWEPAISLADSLAGILEDARERVQREQQAAS